MAGEEDRPLTIDYTCGWGIPLLLVMFSIGMDYSDIDVDVIPEFGGARCRYTKRYAMLAYFGVIMMLSIIMNIILYTHTSFNIRKAMKNSATAIKNQDNQFTIYVRLMGITWIFGFISAFIDELAVQIIFVILVSLQGLFLCVSFICNKAVMS